MKGAIPIVIAITLLLAIIVSSLYFITTLNIESSIGVVSYSTMDWIKLDNELNTLTYLCLKEGSQEADKVFVEKYEEELQSTPIPISDFTDIIEVAEQEANETMYRRVLEIIGNWTILKEKEGYFIDFQKICSNYVVDFGKGYSNVYFTVNISNIHGDYRVFKKNMTVYFGLKLNITSHNLDPSDVLTQLIILSLSEEYSINFTFKFIIEAYIELNGNRMYFVPDTSTLDSLSYSFFYEFIEFIAEIFSIGEPPNININFLGHYYYGEGKCIAVYQISVQGDDALTLFTILSIFMDQYIGRLGFTTNINIDGLIARSATLIVST